eukprot:440106_1
MGVDSSHHIDEKSDKQCCDGNVRHCTQLQKLCSWMKDDNIDKCYGRYSNHIVEILDSFNHLLTFHNKDERQFQYISANLFGSDCDVIKCAIISRYYGYSITVDKTSKNKLLSIKEILDGIHCHMCHGYDIGFRLTGQERSQVDDFKTSNKTKPSQVNAKLIKLQSILDAKRSKFEHVTQNQRYSKSNKYASGFCQVAFKDDNSGSINCYSYSFPFNYHTYCKHNNQIAYYHLTYAQLNVIHKHNNLKDEMLNNTICRIGILGWEIKFEKMICLRQTQVARKLRAKTNEYAKNLQFLVTHPIYFGYKEDTAICGEHLMSLMIYCSFDTLQRKFTETYRALTSKESFEEIKERHSNYYHLAKYIKESVEVFGTEYDDGVIKTMYHGIQNELVFDSMAAQVFSPLSTTYSWNVAIQFSSNTGLIVELVPGTSLKYFSCEWLSPFSYEGELLFIGGLTSINFLNVTMCQIGWCFKKYIQSLRMIANMSHGNYFMNDPSDIHIIQEKQSADLSVLKLRNVSETIKQICLALIHHELNRNGYNMNVFEKYADLHPYIDQLLHRICVAADFFRINWTAMHVNMLTKCDAISGNGYIGYLFMESLFCANSYEGINLDLCIALFPNLTYLEVIGLSLIESEFLIDIYNFINSNSASKIEKFCLNIDAEFKYGNIKYHMVINSRRLDLI